MASFSCLSIFEAGSFGSDSGTVIIPSVSVPFPITSMSVGAGTIAFAATADYDESSVGTGSITFAAAGVGESKVDAVGSGSITFAAVGDDDTPPLGVTERELIAAGDGESVMVSLTASRETIGSSAVMINED